MSREEHARYCSGACEREHKVLLSYGPPAPPIVHPAGVIPPEVEQAITEQIERRRVFEDLVVDITLDVRDLPAKILAELGRPPHPVLATKAEVEQSYARLWADIQAATPPPAGWLNRLLRGWGVLLAAVTAPLAGIRTARTASSPRTDPSADRNPEEKP